MHERHTEQAPHGGIEDGIHATASAGDRHRAEGPRFREERLIGKIAYREDQAERHRVGRGPSHRIAVPHRHRYVAPGVERQRDIRADGLTRVSIELRASLGEHAEGGRVPR